MHEPLRKRVKTALALAILDCNHTMAELLDEVERALSMPPSMAVPHATLADALEVAELAWQIEAPGAAGETLNGLAFNLLPKLRASLRLARPNKGGGGREEGEDFKAQLKRISTSAARREGMGEQVKASGLTAESKGKAFGFGPTLHQMAGGSTEFLVDLEGNRRFWPVGREIESSGLAAEGNEAAASSAMPTAAADGANKGEPGAGA